MNHPSVLVALGNYEGGELCFSQPQLFTTWTRTSCNIDGSNAIELFTTRGDVCNYIVTKGIRHNIIYYIHKDFFNW